MREHGIVSDAWFAAAPRLCHSNPDIQKPRARQATRLLRHPCEADYFDMLPFVMLSLFAFELFDMPTVLCFVVLLLAILPFDMPSLDIDVLFDVVS